MKIRMETMMERRDGNKNLKNMEIRMNITMEITMGIKILKTIEIRKFRMEIKIEVNIELMCLRRG